MALRSQQGNLRSDNAGELREIGGVRSIRDNARSPDIEQNGEGGTLSDDHGLSRDERSRADRRGLGAWPRPRQIRKVLAAGGSRQFATSVADRPKQEDIRTCSCNSKLRSSASEERSAFVQSLSLIPRQLTVFFWLGITCARACSRRPPPSHSWVRTPGGLWQAGVRRLYTLGAGGTSPGAIY